MDINGYTLPDNISWEIYEGQTEEWYLSSFYGLLFIADEHGDIFAGHFYTQKIDGKVRHIFASHGVVRIINCGDAICILPERAKETKEARIKSLEKQLKALKGE
jgi:hypothetical protein